MSSRLNDARILMYSHDSFGLGHLRRCRTIAHALGVSPFVIGMVIIGFGTSAPELCVSALSGLTGHSNLSLGNAYGSAIVNIACILGISALIRPLTVKPAIIFVAAPALALISAFSCLKSSESAFVISTTAAGSIKSVAPEAD